jgi:RND family efflux transporter MFP subunit
MTQRMIAHLLCLGVVLAVGTIGCAPKPEAKEDKKTECSYVLPQLKETVQDQAEYTGRTAAVGSVDVKARVTGFLLETNLFKEGDPVRKGQPLFQIDPKPYEAQLLQAEAQVGLYEAQVELTSATYDQAVEVSKKNPNTFSALQLRTYKAQKDEAQAGLKAARASLEIYRLNKGYTTVTAPIDGVVGRRNQTPGNVIIQDQTLLTTVVALDRIYVYFDMDAPTYARFNQAKPEKSTRTPIFLDMPTRAGVSATPSRIQGEVDFFNNQFNPATDTILVRGVFPNPTKTEAGSPLRPGMFVRVTISIGQPYPALLVPDKAILSKMGKKYVYVVGPDNVVKEIPVVIGQLQEQIWRVIKRETDPKTGEIKPGQLTAEDRVIVTRLLDIQPNQQVVPVPQQSSTEK